MGLTTIEWTLFLCFCAYGIQYSYSFVQQMREMEQNCFRDGGYCINVNPPPAPRRRNNRQRPRSGPATRGPGAGGPGAGRMGTRTRKGKRPDPRALGAQHTRLPAAAAAGAAPPRGGAPPPRGRAPPARGGAAYQPPTAQPPYDPAAPATGGQAATQQNSGLFGSSSNDPFGSLFGMMMFTRKKRQVPEPAERPRRQRGQGMYPFLNQHCRKSEFDFGCRREGGMCCLPFLK